MDVIASVLLVDDGVGRCYRWMREIEEVRK
jgi:hypothetical protein